MFEISGRTSAIMARPESCTVDGASPSAQLIDVSASFDDVVLNQQMWSTGKRHNRQRIFTLCACIYFWPQLHFLDL
jgi:hypothetical protein